MALFIPERHIGALKTKNKVAQNAKTKTAYNKLHSRVRNNLVGFLPYKTEVLFHPTRKWRIDYAWPELKIGIEIHGGVHSNGRHTRGVGFTSDREKMNEAQLLGWIILEVCPNQISQMREWIMRAMEERGASS